MSRWSRCTQKQNFPCQLDIHWTVSTFPQPAGTTWVLNLSSKESGELFSHTYSPVGFIDWKSMNRYHKSQNTACALFIELCHYVLHHNFVEPLKCMWTHLGPGKKKFYFRGYTVLHVMTDGPWLVAIIYLYSVHVFPIAIDTLPQLPLFFIGVLFWSCDQKSFTVPYDDCN